MLFRFEWNYFDWLDIFKRKKKKLLKITWRWYREDIRSDPD